MAAIQEKAPHAEYFALRVFHQALRTRVEFLLEALEWCVDHQIDIANLSLGTMNADHAPRFEAFLKHAGTLAIMAAASALPGSLPQVIGVNLDLDCPRDAYRYHGGKFAASGYPRPIPGVPVERNLQGISFAVANMTGFAARTRRAGSRFHQASTGRHGTLTLSGSTKPASRTSNPLATRSAFTVSRFSRSLARKLTLCGS